LVDALAGAGIQHALFMQPEFLSVGGALRNLRQLARPKGRTSLAIAGFVRWATSSS
jgi:hypothetical protein